VNPRTRRAALYAIGAIAILAGANALAHSYAGLYDWAVHHRLTGWQAMSWPAAAGFDAFEVIRIAARDWQNRVPELFAAFMTAADAAVDGREALTIAPSLPPADGGKPGDAVVAGAISGQAADALTTLAAALRDRLTSAAAVAGLPGDRAACQDAAQAAGRHPGQRPAAKASIGRR
jgi:hypothetical protein